MPVLTGLPDFQTLTSGGAVCMFASFGGGGYTVLPQQLVVAADSDGNPKFQLELVKRLGDSIDDSQYSVLDLALVGEFPLDEALTMARAVDVSATVNPAVINSGFARLYASNSQVAPASDLLAPIPLGWTGPDYARWTMRLSANAGELLKQALLSRTAPLAARVEYDIAGVAARVPVVVEFDPTSLISSLTNKSNRQISRSDLLTVLTGPLDAYPVKITGTRTNDFAEALLGRLIAEYGSLVSSPGIFDPPYVQFQDAADASSLTLRWDLSEPALAFRQYVLMFDPLQSLCTMAPGADLNSLVRNVTIPPAQIGICSVVVTANLPANRIGIPAIGANVEVPANPPFRPSSIGHSITFTEPDDEGSWDFRLSPAEPLNYTVSGFSVLTVGEAVLQYNAPARIFSDPWVRMTTADFPVTFVHATAADRLLGLAEIRGSLKYTINQQAHEQLFSLTSQRPEVCVAFPTAATDPSIWITALPKDGSSPLDLPTMMPGRVRLDVSSFREYGPHRLTVQCQFDSESGSLAIDLVPEEKAGDDTEVTSITLIPGQPQQTWGYVASSPFHSGYCYRKSVGPNSPPNPWSPVISPFAALSLNADGEKSATP